MAGFGNTFRKTLNDAVFRDQAFGQIFVRLNTADPGPDGQTGTEVSGGSYAAFATTGTTWTVGTAADPSVVSNAALISFAAASAPWGTVTHVSLWLHATSTLAANFVGATSIPPQVVTTGNTFTFPIGNLAHSFDSV